MNNAKNKYIIFSRYGVLGDFLSRIGFSSCGVGKNTFISPVFAVSLHRKQEEKTKKFQTLTHY